MITQTHDLNLIPGSVPPVVNVTQYDKTARTLVFNLWDGETSFSVPSGAAVTIRGTKPDGNGFEYTATASGSTVSMDLQQQMATCAGSVRCEVRIASGTQILGTADFILEVKPSALNENTPLSETELPLINYTSYDQLDSYMRRGLRFARGVQGRMNDVIHHRDGSVTEWGNISGIVNYIPEIISYRIVQEDYENLTMMMVSNPDAPEERQDEIVKQLDEKLMALYEKWEELNG